MEVEQKSATRRLSNPIDHKKIVCGSREHLMMCDSRQTGRREREEGGFREDIFREDIPTGGGCVRPSEYDIIYVLFHVGYDAPQVHPVRLTRAKNIKNEKLFSTCT